MSVSRKIILTYDIELQVTDYTYQEAASPDFTNSQPNKNLLQQFYIDTKVHRDSVSSNAYLFFEKAIRYRMENPFVQLSLFVNFGNEEVSRFRQAEFQLYDRN